MTTKAHRCPVCLQVLNDPAALDRVHQNIQKLQAKQDAAFKLKEAELRASMKAEQRKAERVTEARLRKAYESKVADAATKARREEREKTERNRLQMEAKLDDMQRKLDRQKPDDLGEVGEADVRKLLHEAFPGDHIERLGKSRGSADIRHEVREQGRSCGVIIYEVKNVGKWSGEYVKQAKKSLALHRGSHVVLVTTAFPAGHKHLTYQGDVAVVHPTIVASLVRTLRQVVIVRAASTGGQGERSRKADQLLQYTKGEEFRRAMKGVAESVADLQRLQAKERQQHDRVWANQAELFRSVEGNHTTVDARIAQIMAGASLSLMTSEDEQDPAAE